MEDISYKWGKKDNRLLHLLCQQHLTIAASIKSIILMLTGQKGCFIFILVFVEIHLSVWGIRLLLFSPPISIPVMFVSLWDGIKL